MLENFEKSIYKLRFFHTLRDAWNIFQNRLYATKILRNSHNLGIIQDFGYTICQKIVHNLLEKKPA